MATTGISFQGVTTGLQTDTLVNAIMDQEGLAVQRLKDRQTLNTRRSTALQSMESGMVSLSTSIAKLYDGFSSRAVSSSDANNTYVSATASGAVAGSYEIKVATVATRGQLGPTMVQDPAFPADPTKQIPSNLAVADPNAAILTSANGSFAVKGTDGVVKAFTLTNNSLNGLRDAINASGAGVTATVINSGRGANPYQLVLTAKDTGTGSTGGVVTLAAIHNEDAGATATTVIGSLGITSGTLTGSIAAPAGLSGGLSSSGSGIATDALFSVNGIQMTRQSNLVKDAVDGVTFTLKKGDSSNATTLTVTQDKATATAAMQDAISKFNAILKTYKDASTTTDDGSGIPKPGPLTQDIVAKGVMNTLRSALRGSPDGLPVSATFKSTADLGIKTNVDGTLSLDTTVFQAALDKDPQAVKNLFAFSGASTNGSVSFAAGGPKTATGDVGFDLTYAAGGSISGLLTVGGTTYSGLTGTNGTLAGPVGSPLEGLILNVTGSGVGTLTLSRGLGQRLQDAISDLTSYTGTIEKTRTSIDEQNRTLTSRIEVGQLGLDKRRAALKAQFNKMESTVATLRAASSSLSGITG